jgi:S1-C subfamily serine protease
MCFGAFFLLFASCVSSQAEKATLKIRVVLVDGDLNQKPVPRLLLRVERVDLADAETVPVRTSFDGTAQVMLAPGRYRVATADGIDYQGKRFQWREEIALNASGATLELSNDNATVTALTAAPKPAPKDELNALYRKYQDTVVTVWSEEGHGTGFVADDELGLILTNDHVVGRSGYVAVQFDEKRKVQARVAAFDIERDIAVLWVDLDAFPEAFAPAMAKPADRGSAVAEGDRVFTIGSPLNQRKVMTSGLVSKVEARAIISDIRINHGNSGGPLFTMDGKVVGLTTFGEGNPGGGISGIVRIEAAALLLDRARTKLRELTPPTAKLLPVDPPGSYPVDALKSSLEAKKFDETPYEFREGAWDIAVVTPILKYHLTEAVRLREQKEKERRTTRSTRAIEGTFRPLDDLKGWEEYAGEYKPVIQIEVSPRLGPDIGFNFHRPDRNQKSSSARRLKYRSDFYSMKLFCGTQEIEPIHPGKVPVELEYHTKEFEISDASFQGIYTYPYDAISPSCGTVTLRIFSEKDPQQPTVKTFDAKTIARVESDFAPIRQAQDRLSSEAAGAK